MSQRKRIEEIFGWFKTQGLIRQVKLRGIKWIAPFFMLHTAGYNVLRMRTPAQPAVGWTPETLPLFA